MTTCWLCGKTDYGLNRLERHHIFGGANRKKSERYGLIVYLCGETCHRNMANGLRIREKLPGGHRP